MENRFDPTKDEANQQKHKLSLSFGDRIFEDENHLILTRWWALWTRSCLPASSFGGTICPASFL